MPLAHAQAPVAGWPHPVECLNEGGASPIVLLCEHASNHIPAEYDRLGLTTGDLERHIAWDIGAATLTRRLADRLDAAAFLGAYSRLLIDLNRPPDADGSIPTRSEATAIPGNRALCAGERRRRWERIFVPYQARVSAHVDARIAARRATALVSIHSFTPVFHGQHRPWHAGILFGAAEAFGRRVIASLAHDPALNVAANQPYSVSRDEDYALLVHGDDRGIPAILVEVRNDGLGDGRQIEDWADRLAGAFASDAVAAATLGRPAVPAPTAIRG